MDVQCYKQGHKHLVSCLKTNINTIKRISVSVLHVSQTLAIEDT